MERVSAENDSSPPKWRKNSGLKRVRSTVLSPRLDAGQLSGLSVERGAVTARLVLPPAQDVGRETDAVDPVAVVEPRHVHLAITLRESLAPSLTLRVSATSSRVRYKLARLGRNQKRQPLVLVLDSRLATVGAFEEEDEDDGMMRAKARI